MSRHRNIRNLRVEDYLDDDYDDYDVYDDEDNLQDEYQQQYLAENRDLSQAQWSNQTQPTSDTLDESLLDEMVIQFRAVLNDNTLTTAEVDQTLREADYDWEKALAALDSRQQTEARQADPSPIGRLLAADDDDANSEQLPTLAATSATAPAPDYHTYVADNGTALAPVPNAAAMPRFRFDQPSPDDVVRAKQARGAARSTPPLRLPKPAGARRTAVAVAAPKSSPLKPPAPPKLTPHAARQDSTSVPTVVKQRTKKINIQTRLESAIASVAVVVAGHVDAGKSTLIGQLLQQLTSASRGGRKPMANLAWDTDEDPVERERGVTIDIAARLIQRPGDPSRTIALIDAPGHRDFVRAMIVGSVQASAAMLVVDAVDGAFEAGLSNLGQTREHAIILKAFGVSSLIIVVNKMDSVDYNQTRFNFIRQSLSDFLRANGWRTSTSVSFVPISGRDSVNLAHGPPPGHPLCAWYSGKTLVQMLDDLSPPSEKVVREVSSKPTRLIVTDFFRNPSFGGQAAVSGRLICGTLAPKDRLSVAPSNVLTTIKSITIGDEARAPVAVAGFDAVPVSVGLTGLPDGYVITKGSLLCDPERVAPIAISFLGRVLITAPDAIVIRGTRGLLHIGGSTETAYVSKLLEYTGGKKQTTASGKKRVPRRLVKGDTAVVEMTCNRGVALEKMDTVKALGRFAFRQAGHTTGVGIVVDILATEKSNIVVENGVTEVESKAHAQPTR